MTFIWLITLAVFMTAMVVSLGLYSHFHSREEIRSWARRLNQNEASLQEGSLKTLFSFWVDKITRVLIRLGEMAKPKSEEEYSGLRQNLVTAGFRAEHAPLLVIGSKLFLAAFGIVLVSMVPAALWGFPSDQKLIIGYVFAACIGYLLPTIWLKLAVRSRQDKIRKSVPDALDLLVTCVEAGLGLDQAIGKVSTDIGHSHPELCDELMLLTLDLRAGMGREEALRRLATRTGLEDVRTLVAVLIQTDRFGTSVAQALRVHAEAMRVKRQLRAEAMAAKLPVKMLFPLIFFILPSLFVVMLGPGVVRIMRIILPMAKSTGS